MVDFDYDNEVLLFSLKYEDDNYTSSDYLIEYVSSLDDAKINNTIKEFMFDYVWSQINCYIEENDYNDWRVLIVDNGLKLKNKLTSQWVTWNIDDYDEDFETIKDKMIKFLNLQNNVNKQ